MNAPLPASTNWKERIAPDEEARFERYAEMLRSLQRARAKGKAARALHAKANVGCYGVLTIAADLPEPLRHGLFAAPRSHECFIRFSNGAGAHQSDTKPDVRGVAIKVLGVPGKKLIPGLEDATTQDFLLIRTSAMAFRSVDEFVAVVWASRSPALALPRLIGALGFSRTLGLLRVLAGSLSAARDYPSVAAAALDEMVSAVNAAGGRLEPTSRGLAFGDTYHKYLADQ